MMKVVMIVGTVLGLACAQVRQVHVEGMLNMEDMGGDTGGYNPGGYNPGYMSDGADTGFDSGYLPADTVDDTGYDAAYADPYNMDPAYIAPGDYNMDGMDPGNKSSQAKIER